MRESNSSRLPNEVSSRELSWLLPSTNSLEYRTPSNSILKRQRCPSHKSTIKQRLALEHLGLAVVLPTVFEWSGRSLVLVPLPRKNNNSPVVSKYHSYLAPPWSASLLAFYSLISVIHSPSFFKTPTSHSQWTPISHPQPSPPQSYLASTVLAQPTCKCSHRHLILRIPNSLSPFVEYIGSGSWSRTFWTPLFSCCCDSSFCRDWTLFCNSILPC